MLTFLEQNEIDLWRIFMIKGTKRFICFLVCLLISITQCKNKVTGGEDEPQDIVDNVTLTGAYLGQTTPGNEAQFFMPENLRSNADWWWHKGVAFILSGQEMYMDIYVGEDNVGISVLYMALIDNEWTTPEAPTFAQGYTTASPSFINNGNKVFFISQRSGGSIWSSTRTPDGWSSPTAISIPWPAGLGMGWEVTATEDETLYLRGSDSSLNTDLDIYRVRKVNGSYQSPERLDDTINSPSMDLSPYVDPEERYLIFESTRPGGIGGSDLYIAFKREDGSWTAAINMGNTINTTANERGAYVSNDGQYLFFLSDRLAQYDSNPYWIDASVIDELNPNQE